MANETYLSESILIPGRKVRAGWRDIMYPYEGQINDKQMVRLLAFIKGLRDARDYPPLLNDRDRLKSDLDALSRRIDEQRNQLRTGITEMQRLLDDPTALKPLPALNLADVDRPTPLGPVSEPHDDHSNGAAREQQDLAPAQDAEGTAVVLYVREAE